MRARSRLELSGLGNSLAPAPQKSPRNLRPRSSGRTGTGHLGPNRAGIAGSVRGPGTFICAALGAVMLAGCGTTVHKEPVNLPLATSAGDIVEQSRELPAAGDDLLVGL